MSSFPRKKPKLVATDGKNVWDEKTVAHKMGAAKLRALSPKHRPYVNRVLSSLIPVAVPGFGTFACDSKWRLYYDPLCVEAWDIPTIATVLLHEVDHCILGHGPRFQNMRQNAGDAPLWNKSADAPINDNLQREGYTFPFPPVFTATLAREYNADLSNAQIAEQIYHTLKKHNPTPPQGNTGNPTGDGGSGGSGTPQPGHDCGSIVDNIPREYEQHGDKIDPGVEPARADLIRRQTAQDIKTHQKTAGNVPGHLQLWADEILNPTVPWQHILTALFRRGLTRVAGRRDYSYSRRSRRQKCVVKATGRNIRMMGMVAPPPPNIAIVLDTSGSMSSNDHAQTLGETEGILKALRVSGGNVKVYTCDTEAGDAQRVKKAHQIDLVGGGGTDLTVGIRKAIADKPRPQMVVVLTDGHTNYPSEPLPYGIELYVVVTEDGTMENVPTWAKAVQRNDSLLPAA